jgi:hypothetical protein
MDTSSIVATIDAEIFRLTQARALLSKGISVAPVKRARRKLSKAARAKIAAAQKARWAKVRAKAKAK